MASSKRKPNSALGLASKLIAKKIRFEAELRQKLNRYPREEVDEAIEHLYKIGALDDEEALRTFCAGHQGKTILSREALAFSLEEKGVRIDPSLLPEATVSELVRALALKKYSKKADLKERARAGRWLCGRGFGDGKVEQALTQYFDPCEEA